MQTKCILTSLVVLLVSQTALALNTSFLTTCESILDCKFPSDCNVLNNDGSVGTCENASDNNCFCLEDDAGCTSSGTCSVGSSCVKFLSSAATTTSTSFCVPCASLSNRVPQPEQVDSMDVCTTTSYSQEASGLILSKCESILNCKYGSCKTFNNDGSLETCSSSSFSPDCFCLRDDESCSSVSDCFVNNDCVKLFDNSESFCAPCSSLKYRFPAPISTNPDEQACNIQHSSPSLDSGETLSGTLESCSSILDCEGFMGCMAVKHSGELGTCNENGASDCFCLDDDDTCTNSNDCSVGSGCARISGSTAAFCVPCSSAEKKSPPPAFVDNNHQCNVQNGVTSSPDSSQPNNSPSATETSISPSPSTLTGGLTLDRCSVSNGDVCRGSRTCVDYQASIDQQGIVDCTSSSSLCGCFPPQSDLTICSSSSTCIEGERCVLLSGLNICISCNADNFGQENIDEADSNCPRGTTDNTDSAPCIAIDALQDFSDEQLVFPQHIRSAVLCDSFENCATPGHIVMFKGKAMMMATYCFLCEGKCRRTVKLVNSPKMRAGLRVVSKSEHIQFTAFSAKYETVLEEMLIRWLLKTGI